MTDSQSHTNGNSNQAHADAHPHPTHRVPYYGKRVYAMRDLLIEKGILRDDDLRRQVEYIEARSPANGARLVARAWLDPAFKDRLIQDPRGACAEMSIDATSLNEFVVLENTPELRNLVVCTLCSCYPRPILGRPPDWYKSFHYRSRAVNDPRGVMREFGSEPSADVEVRVHDSTADVRYLVLPERPAGTENLSEAELAQLVTRDSLVGVETARPAAVVH